MGMLKKKSIQQYSKYLQTHPEEGRILLETILIKVTEFFRDSQSFLTVRKKVLKPLIKKRPPETPIRIWIVGCATGEEAYSIAISTLEALGKSTPPPTVQIFATDISESAIQTARAGIYPLTLKETVPEDFLNRYFTKSEKGYKVKKIIRDLCLFCQHDVSVDPPFAKIDLVCCRNLLIYFDTDLQQRVFPILHYSLNPGGFLWLGRSESAGSQANLFQVIDKKHKIYAREEAQGMLRREFPTRSSTDRRPSSTSPSHPERSSPQHDLQKQVEAILISEYAPPGVVVNNNMEILMTQGETGAFLQLPPGAVSLNLFKMAQHELVRDLRMVTQAAKTQNKIIHKTNIIIHKDGKTQAINLSVIPLKSHNNVIKPDFLILFKLSDDYKKNLGTQQKSRPTSLALLKDQRVSALEKDLRETKTYQQSLIEDFEANQEEMTAAIEELQSINEELQSTNEELESTKEELESTNDELLTRNDELIHLNSDLNSILGSIDFPILMVSPEGLIRRFTPKAQQLFRLGAEEIGRSINTLSLVFDGVQLQRLALDSINSLNSYEQDVQDPQKSWFRLQITPYKTIDHRVAGAIISLVDINLLKQNLIRSQIALKYANSIANTFPLPLVVLDENLRLLSSNDEFSKFFQLSVTPDSGMDILTLLEQNNWATPDLRILLSQIIEAKKPIQNYRIEHDFPGIGRRILLINAKQILWESPMPPAMLISFDDISERTTIADNLQQSQASFRTVFEQSHDAMLMINHEGRIEFANEQTCHWFGYSASELIGEPIEMLFPNRFKKAPFQIHQLFSALSQSKIVGTTLDIMGKRKDDSEFSIDLSLSQFKTPAGEKTSIAIRDLTQVKSAEMEKEKLLFQERQALAAAEKANQSKDLFLATLSHELRTPLTSILAWSQLLKRGPIQAEQLKKGLEIIEHNAHAQGQLINDLLDVSSIQAGKLSLSRQVIDPMSTILRIIDAIKPLATAKKISLELHNPTPVDPPLGHISVDPVRLQQILWNLLVNAIKFSHSSGRVEMDVKLALLDHREYMAIRVHDLGRGIHPEFIPHLFNRFTQQDSSSTRSQGGLGIGLALVRDLVEAQDGLIQAESAGSGKGATFTLFFPRVAPPKKKQTHEQITHAPPIDLSGVKILLLDDEKNFLSACVIALDSLGAQSITRHSVAEALETFHQFKPDLVVSDIAMPLEDGYSFIRTIRALPAHEGGITPALALTAFASPEDIKKALQAGFDIHLSKPVDLTELTQKLSELAKHARGKKS